MSDVTKIRLGQLRKFYQGSVVGTPYVIDGSFRGRMFLVIGIDRNAAMSEATGDRMIFLIDGKQIERVSVWIEACSDLLSETP